MAYLKWVVDLPPMVGIMALFITGFAFASIVWLRLNYQMKKIEELQKEKNVISEQAAINKTDIEWLRAIFKIKKSKQ